MTYTHGDAEAFAAKVAEHSPAGSTVVGEAMDCGEYIAVSMELAGRRTAVYCPKNNSPVQIAGILSAGLQQPGI